MDRQTAARDASCTARMGLGRSDRGAGDVSREDDARRDREEQLLFVGNQYRQAIGRYWQMGGVYPRALEELRLLRRRDDVGRDRRATRRGPTPPLPRGRDGRPTASRPRSRGRARPRRPPRAPPPAARDPPPSHASVAFVAAAPLRFAIAAPVLAVANADTPISAACGAATAALAPARPPLIQLRA